MSYKFEYPRLAILADFEAVTGFLPYAPQSDMGIVTVDNVLTIQGHTRTSGIVRYTDIPIKGNWAFGVSVPICREIVDYLKASTADTVEVELNPKGLWVAGRRMVNLWEKTIIVSKVLSGAKLIAKFETNAATLRANLTAAAEQQKADQGLHLVITHYGANLSTPQTNNRSIDILRHQSVIEAVGKVYGEGQTYDVHRAGEALRLIPPPADTVTLLFCKPAQPNAPHILATKTADTVRLMSIRPLYMPACVTEISENSL